MAIKSDNARDGALSGFFSFDSTNRIGGSGASDLDALGFGWVELLIHLYFPSSGSRFVLCCLLLILAIVECINLNCTYIL